ncbi:hypothetical protein HDU96_003643 [Phlyctochytrium bullatum]|nr:hypothetical protein HDU96_003643 [Phlyctochytrium bullatum]
MAEPDELILSDVHITDPSSPPPHPTDLTGFVTTVFVVDLADSPDVDDGLYGLTTLELPIRHRLATPLSDVGTQVWRASLLLCDYLLHLRPFLASRRHNDPPPTILELASGTGLPSLLLAHLGWPHTILTDHDAGVLDLAAHNVATAAAAGAKGDHCGPHQPHPPTFPASALHAFHTSCDLLLAADALYLDTVTFALASHLPSLLMKPGPGGWETRYLLLAQELRVQFTVEEREARAVAWERFVGTVEAVNAEAEVRRDGEEDGWEGVGRGGFRVVVREVEVGEVPKRMGGYERAEEVKLWVVYLTTLGDAKDDGGCGGGDDVEAE